MGKKSRLITKTKEKENEGCCFVGESMCERVELVKRGWRECCLQRKEGEKREERDEEREQRCKGAEARRSTFESGER